MTFGPTQLAGHVHPTTLGLGFDLYNLKL